MKKGIVIYFSLILCVSLVSCEKEYTCVCTKITSNEKVFEERVKTTKLGKKGFEKSCKAKSSEVNNLRDCHVE